MCMSSVYKRSDPASKEGSFRPPGSTPSAGFAGKMCTYKTYVYTHGVHVHFVRAGSYIMY